MKFIALTRPTRQKTVKIVEISGTSNAKSIKGKLASTTLVLLRKINNNALTDATANLIFVLVLMPMSSRKPIIKRGERMMKSSRSNFTSTTNKEIIKNQREYLEEYFPEFVRDDANTEENTKKVLH